MLRACVPCAHTHFHSVSLPNWNIYISAIGLHGETHKWAQSPAHKSAELTNQKPTTTKTTKPTAKSKFKLVFHAGLVFAMLRRRCRRRRRRRPRALCRFAAALRDPRGYNIVNVRIMPGSIRMVVAVPCCRPQRSRISLKFMARKDAYITLCIRVKFSYTCTHAIHVRWTWTVRRRFSLLARVCAD